MKGAQHKDPTMLAPIEGEASQLGRFYFSFTFREGKGRENKGKKNKKNVKKGGESLVGRVVAGGQ
jgi:hypothetical protein